MAQRPRASPRRLLGDVPSAVHVHLALTRAFARASAAHTHHFARWGLTPQQYNAMRILYFADAGAVRLSEIGDQLLERVPDVSRLVDRLERAGMARRRPDPDDGRAVLVELTSTGRDLVEAMDGDLMDAHEAWYQALTPVEQRRLASLLEKVAAAFETSDSGEPAIALRPAASDTDTSTRGDT